MLFRSATLPHYGESSYVVCMEKKQNRFLRIPNGLAKSFLEFLVEAHLQHGSEYQLDDDFPKKILPIVQILYRAKLLSLVDVDDNGVVTYDSEEQAA